jgi:3-deoxy-manno-octulosonate cytidylyltransferase (CMP-KDO synthetase)
MKVICVIPARLKSTRFPQKVLATLGDKPLLQWVWEAALATGKFDEIHFAIDAAETADLIDTFKGLWTQTDPECLTGTDRMIDFAKESGVTGDVWVNWQADEPFITGGMIATLLDGIEEISTLRKEMKDEAIDNPNVVKVVTDCNDNALYFSRAAIPYMRTETVPVYKHFGIYAFTDAALKKVSALPPCQIEEAELLEQLRFLYHGLKIKVHETIEDSIGIDHPSDLALAEQRIRSVPAVYT